MIFLPDTQDIQGHTLKIGRLYLCSKSVFRGKDIDILIRFMGYTSRRVFFYMYAAKGEAAISARGNEQRCGPHFIYWFNKEEIKGPITPITEADLPLYVGYDYVSALMQDAISKMES